MACSLRLKLAAEVGALWVQDSHAGAAQADCARGQQGGVGESSTAVWRRIPAAEQLQ